MFWTIVVVILVVALGSAWFYDRRHKIRSGGVKSPDQDRAMGEARASIIRRNDLQNRG